MSNKRTWPVEDGKDMRGQAEELTRNFRYLYAGEAGYTHASLYYMSIHNDAQVRLVFIDIKSTATNCLLLSQGKTTHYSINFRDIYVVIVNVDRDDHIYHVF